jgi:hypothetical protein
VAAPPAPARVVVAPPPPPPAEVEPEPEIAREVTLCAICQTVVDDAEEKTTCPSCGLEFHANCWRENYGCSAYGCDQVNVLAPPEERERIEAANAAVAGEVTPFAVPDADVEPEPTFPWESVLLSLSFVGMFLSALGFGIPSAVMLLASLTFLVIRRAHRKSLVVVAILVSVAGSIAGYGMSMFWWRGVRVWEAWLR